MRKFSHLSEANILTLSTFRPILTITIAKLRLLVII